MTATRDISNKRVTFSIGLASALANLDNGWATDVELNALTLATPAIRWNGLDFAQQASGQVDDRSLDDDALAVLRGFPTFGGKVPFFFPKITDSGILRTVYNLVKTQGTELALAMRIGFQDRKTAYAPGDEVNLYKVMTDGFLPDAAGDGGYAYIQNFIPRGDDFPWSVVGSASPGAVTVTGSATNTVASPIKLYRAVYQGVDVTNRCTWVSSDPTKMKIDNRGIAEAIATGTATVVAKYPGGTDSTPLSVTIT